MIVPTQDSLIALFFLVENILHEEGHGHKDDDRAYRREGHQPTLQIAGFPRPPLAFHARVKVTEERVLLDGAGVDAIKIVQLKE